MQEEKQSLGNRLSKMFATRREKDQPEGSGAEPERSHDGAALPPEIEQPLPHAAEGEPRDEVVARVAEAMMPQFFAPHFSVELPTEGATMALWALYYAESGGGDRPVLMLDDVPDGKPFLLSDEQAGSELARLRTGVELRAGARLKLIREQNKKTDAIIHLPGECMLHVAQTGSMAWIFLFPPLGEGEPVGMDGVMTAMRKGGVTTGIDGEEIQRRVTGGRYFELFAIAWGTPAQEGQDGRIIEYYERENVRDLVVDAQGIVDYREQNYVRAINKDDVICDVIFPVPGTDGEQVTGKAIKARPTQPARPPAGKNTTLTEDGAHLVATVDGHLDFSGQVFQVKSTLEVAGDVDYSTGNINVFGDVHIKGDVRENFTVRATGDVTIDGLVESATVEADGNITITKGVLGDNKAMIRSRKTVRAKYLENCVVYAGDCVFADCIISSQVYSDNRVSVITGRGTIIGGCISAAKLVEALVIGTKAGRRNEVILGRMPNVEQERAAGLVTRQELQDQVEDIDRQIHYLEPREDTPENGKLLGKLRLNRSVQNLKLEKLTRRLAELEGLTPDMAVCRLRCGRLYPLTNITIGNCNRVITDEWVNSTTHYDMESRDIVFT